MKRVSFVIPVKDEMPTLASLCAEIVEMAGRESLDYELIFIDDGSTDGSWAEIRRLAAENRRILGLKLRRNFGKAAALMAGFSVVGSEIVFTLDADLQDDPHEIPKFLERLNSGYDFVSGWKRKRHDPWHKVWPSRVFNKMIGWFTGLHLHDNVCGFKGFRAEIIREVRLYGDMHRFFAVKAFAKGYKVTEVEVNHRPRTHGYSKYGVSRFLKGFLDLLTVWFSIRFARRPMHLIGGVGLACVAGGILTACLYSIVTGLIITILGLQFFALGFAVEQRLAGAVPDEELYSIAERVGFASNESRG